SGAQSAAIAAGDAVPMAQPPRWDAVTFNRVRGNAGAIPASYLDDINGPDGDTNHLGKHLPYVPELDAQTLPAGMIAIMWGDPNKEHARHPNAPRNEANNNEGHWYNWIRISKATDADREEVQSTYTDWPGIGSGASGAYAVHGDGSLEDEGGKNTIYLAALPSDVGSGDTIRIYAHCLTHGEYVDFLTLP
ncbi:MAG: hypothetical protein ACJA1R_001154, partial [Flavobacteriales bacterium]